MIHDKEKRVQIGIVGLGLIGGSLAKAIRRKRGNITICAVDHNMSMLQQAQKEGVITSYSSDLSYLANCDVVFLCVPPGVIFEVICELSLFYTGIVSDVASTKEKICHFVENNYPAMRFVPGHPMAGSEKTGYDASTENLFENAPYLLCHFTDSLFDGFTKASPDFDTIKQFVEDIGARPYLLSPKRHDRLVGMISHLPHIIAYTLVDFIRNEEDDVLKEIAAGGFRDLTRIASSDPNLWTDIIMESGDSSADLLDSYISLLADLSGTLKLKDQSALYKSFEKAKQFRDQMLFHTGNQKNTTQVWVEVDDRPGMIGKITVLLGDRGINIKNINIQDNREYEGGSMRITLSSMEDATRAGILLNSEGLIFRIVS
jgi:prephenate dehydrogenase